MDVLERYMVGHIQSSRQRLKNLAREVRQSQHLFDKDDPWFESALNVFKVLGL
jgi:hypothetical protein